MRGTLVDLPWRRALVTGASRGLGRAFVRELAAQGVDVILVARDRDSLATVAAQTAEVGSRTEILVADLSDADQLARVEERLRDGTRPVDLLINNAAAVTTGAFGTGSAATETEVLLVNAVALTRLTHAAIDQMRGAGGAICNVSSLGGRVPMGGNAVYGATKAFVTSFSLAVAEELRGTGVTLTVACPGFTATGGHDRGGFDASWVPRQLWLSAETVARAVLRDVAAGRERSVPGRGYDLLDRMLVAAPTGLRRWTGASYVRWGRRLAELRGPAARALGRGVDGKVGTS